MHHALCISEILTAIFRHFGRKERRELATCARTCHAWFISAIEVLWRVLETPTQMLNLLGDRIIDMNACWDFAATPSQKHWGRLLVYSSHIRTVQFSRWHVPMRYDSNSNVIVSRAASASALQVLANPKYASGESFIFPSFQRWETAIQEPVYGRDCDLAAMYDFIRPGLREVRFTPGGASFGDGLKVAQAFRLVGERCRNLRSFSIWLRDLPQGKFAEALEAIAELPLLESFQLSPGALPTGILKALSRLNNFKILNTASLEEADGITPFDMGSFPRLETLKIDHLPLKTSMLLEGHHFRPQSLRVIEIGSREKEGFRFMMDTIIASRATIQDISIRSNQNLNFAVLQPISTFSRLQYLQLYGVKYLECSDAEMELILRGVPELRRWATRSLPSPSRNMPSLITLQHLRHHCPKIESFCMTLDASEVPPTPINITSTTSTRRKIILDLWLSILNNPEVIARWIEAWAAGCYRLNLIWLDSPAGAGWKRVHTQLRDSGCILTQ